MSKAFTRESDDLPESLTPVRRSPLPVGVKNLITAGGLKRLQDELATLERFPQGAADSMEASSPSQTRLRRIGELRAILETAVIAPSPAPHDDRVRFGARVKIRESNGNIVEYRIVGVDEIDLADENISWRSPLASALLNKRAGERVLVRLPAGQQHLEILNFSYD